MILLLSDIHFGRKDAGDPRLEERRVLDFLRAHENAVERLYLLGDIFEQYIEYRYLAPKGYVRFQALLAEWVDRGIPVTYLVGNHDPWHRDHFERELGVRVIFDELVEPIHDRNVYLFHGDGLAPATRKYNLLKPVLRHPVPVALYRNLIPGDWGFALARWVSARFGGNELKPKMVDQMRDRAREILTGTEVDAVVMGHSHHPEHQVWPEGEYLNLGSWFWHRTYGIMDEGKFKLVRWLDGASEQFD